MLEVELMGRLLIVHVRMLEGLRPYIHLQYLFVSLLHPLLWW